VIPIFFHGRNSAVSHILGLIDWRLRTLRLPTEVFRKRSSTIHVSIGDPIMPDEQKAHQGSLEEFGKFLREKTYELKQRK
jgi:putative hemolysin